MDYRLIQHLCRRAGGYFVPNARTNSQSQPELLPAMCKAIEGFAGVEEAMARAMKDNRVTREEANEITRRWEELKSIAEAFVKACQKDGVHPAGATARALPRNQVNG